MVVCGWAHTCAVETVCDVFPLYPCAHLRAVIRTNWVMESTLEGHLDRIKSSLATGRATLRSMQGTELTTYSVPDTVPDHSIAYMQPPEESDKYVTSHHSKVTHSNPTSFQ